MSADSISLELLDPHGEQVVQCWEFHSPGVLQIGRSRDCDVVVGSPYVSRSHAYVSPCPEGFKVCSISDHGVFVDGKKQEQFLLTEGLTFRLGNRGPILRVRFQEYEKIDSDRCTVAFDPSQIPFYMDTEAGGDDNDTAMIPAPAKSGASGSGP
jgi:predicted component of type VI protein secretion system